MQSKFKTLRTNAISRFHNWGKRLSNILLSPSDKITTQDRRTQARLLSSIILLTLAIIVFLMLTPRNELVIGDAPEPFILLIAGCVMIGLYIASRTRHYLPTAVTTISLLILTILLVFSESTSGIDYAYLSVVILVASVLLDIRLLLLTIAGTMIGTLALISDHPEMSFNSDPFLFMVVASITTIFVGFYHRYQESSRTEALVDREARLQLILEQMPAILWTTDENLIVTSSTGSGFNQIAIEADEIVGKWIASAPPMEKLSMFRTEAHYDALSGKSGTYESNWGDVVFQCFIEPLHDARHKVIGCVGVALDITARRSVEQVAVDLRVEKERVNILSDFIQNATHDLSTPLSVMNASIYLLRNTSELDKQKRHLDSLDHQTERLGELVKSMVTMLRLDKMDSFSKGAVDINSLLHNLPYSFETKMQVKRLTLRKDLDPSLPAVLANESYLLQAMEEILDNAIQFTNVGGTITLYTRHEDRRAVIEIRDTGIGIAPEDQIQIFDRFYRVDKSRSTSTGGNGLGLAIAKRVIEGHGGRIHVNSQPGEGTTLRITLPVEPMHETLMTQ